MNQSIFIFLISILFWSPDASQASEARKKSTTTSICVLDLHALAKVKNLKKFQSEVKDLGRKHWNLEVSKKTAQALFDRFHSLQLSFLWTQERKVNAYLTKLLGMKTSLSGMRKSLAAEGYASWTEAMEAFGHKRPIHSKYTLTEEDAVHLILEVVKRGGEVDGNLFAQNEKNIVQNAVFDLFGIERKPSAIYAQIRKNFGYSYIVSKALKMPTKFIFSSRDYYRPDRAELREALREIAQAGFYTSSNQIRFDPRGKYTDLLKRKHLLGATGPLFVSTLVNEYGSFDEALTDAGVALMEPPNLRTENLINLYNQLLEDPNVENSPLNLEQAHELLLYRAESDPQLKDVLKADELLFTATQDLHEDFQDLIKMADRAGLGIKTFGGYTRARPALKILSKKMFDRDLKIFDEIARQELHHLSQR